MLHSFPLYNVTICNFCELLKCILTEYNDIMQQYHVNRFDSNAKRVLTHCIIKHCCDVAMGITQGKVVFYYSSECIQVPEDENDKIKEFIHKLIMEATKKLPLTWYCSSKPIDYYRKLINNNQGMSFLMQISNGDKVKYSYDKAARFITKYKLVFLNNNYFNCLKTKCMLLNT
jgi:hypothetical protein